MDDNKNIEIIDELNKLRNKIVESVRIGKKNISKISYVEISDNLKNISTKANFVLFGRRGTGKSILLGNLHKLSKERDFYSIGIDCELIKKYSYPDIIIFIIKEIFEDLVKGLGCSLLFSKKRKLIAKISKELSLLDEKLEQVGTLKIMETQEKEEYDGSKAQIGGENCGAKVYAKGSVRTKDTRKYEKIEIKIRFLDHKIKKYQELIDNSIRFLKKESLYILLDDLYFISQEIQFKLIDYIHKLCKGAQAYFKVSTIRHRSKIYERTNTETLGIQGVADFRPIDLDYTLDRPELTEQFMKKILSNILKNNNLNLDINSLFVENIGLRRLVWASGGVPRDFLNILIYILDEIISEGKFKGKIGKDKINSACAKYYQEKLNEFSSKIFKESKSLELLNYILKECIEKEKKTAFLIKKGSLGKNSLLELFNNLIDLRLIHLVRKNETSKKMGGEMYDAYILDIGAYAGELRLRKGIKEIDIYEKGLKSKDSPFRYRAPELNINEIKQILKVNQSYNTVQSTPIIY